jgi:hypothetical protein
VLIFPDGCYIGEVDAQYHPHGIGQTFSAKGTSKSEPSQEWFHGVEVQWGLLTLESNAGVPCRYEGQYSDGVPHGLGMLVLESTTPATFVTDLRCGEWSQGQVVNTRAVPMQKGSAFSALLSIPGK